MSIRELSRRGALGSLGAFFAGSAVGTEQRADPSLPLRLPPREELVNSFEFEDVAKLKLPESVYSAIAGSDRAAFDRMTFRPQRMTPTVDMDLSVGLFGEEHFTPILVGPVADQKQYHADGELATVRGASAARAGTIISSRSSVSINQLAPLATTPLWYSVYVEEDALGDAQQAVAAGCQAVSITIGVSGDGARASAAPSPDWNVVDQVRQGIDVPLLVKGVMTPADAEASLDHGAAGIIVSNHGEVGSGPAPIEMLPSIADAVGGRVPVLIDGGFRRGSDILKAMVLGARGVLLARPVMWGLAAYGAEGVQSVIEMLQSAFARNMGSIGAPNLASLERGMVRIHSR